ncbi:redoxin domain-containing protein [Candidatus Microgenomates bacterium]|nr:redoxin domain-containing protein [Candidatus Microgenomates bacterium]
MIQINQNIKDIAEIVDFSFEYYQGDKIKKAKLVDFKGQWLALIFYPADFTFICPTELEDASHHYEEFQKEGCEVISVSTDTVFTHKAWHDESKAIGTIKFPMAADPTGTLCRAFGTYIESEGLSLRGTFLIDPDGVLKTIEIHDNSVGRSADELLRKLQAAKFVRENGGEVCPANWHPGEKTLKPGLDLVGKI